MEAYKIMVDFSKIKSDGKAWERLAEKFKQERQEYEVKINKLVIEFNNGRLPDTNFVNSFIPRVSAKFKADLFPLTEREKEVIDDLFDKY